MSLLLDTCALFALAEDGRPFSPAARQALEAPGSKVWISAISAFEVGQKEASGKLHLPCPPMQWFQDMLKHHQVNELPLTSTICLAATALPPIHKDPFDRLIIATALQHNFTLLTSDRDIPAYPGIQTLW